MSFHPATGWPPWFFPYPGGRGRDWKRSTLEAAATFVTELIHAKGPAVRFHARRPAAGQVMVITSLRNSLETKLKLNA